MESPAHSLAQLARTGKRLASRLLTIGENRLQLLTLELQEERERLVLVFLLALGAAVFGLLAGVALTVAIAILFWKTSPILAMLVLAGFYGACAIWFYARFSKIQRTWQTLPATIEQLRKDRECLEQNLA